MDQRHKDSDSETANDPLNDSWFDRPGRSLTPVPFSSERPSYEYIDTRPSDMDLDDSWFV